MPSDQTAILPPLPFSVASALIVAVLLTVVFCACGASPLPCQSPPTRTVPPPCVPEASIVPVILTVCAKASTLPPLPSCPVTSTLPVWFTIPLSACKVTFPAVPSRLCARTIPSWFTTALVRSSPALAVMSTMPPSASTSPLLLTTALSAPLPGTTSTLPSPLKSSVASLPAARATVPFFATMTPLFSTSGASIATRPLFSATICPWLMTLPSFPAFTNAKRPDMKSGLEIFMVEATRLPTLICEPGAKSTPPGFTRKTRPFALIAPKICEGDPPTTRFKIAEAAFGCRNWTRSLAAILKLCQFMTAFCVCC